jgi:hypothetical protein
VTGFVADVNSLAFSKLIEVNSRTLIAIYEQQLEWAKKLRALFAPDRYILVHFTKA